MLDYTLCFLFLIYLFSFLMSANFLALKYGEIKYTTIANVMTKRLMKGKTIRHRWGLRNQLLLSLIFSVAALCPLLNTYVAWKSFKVLKTYYLK